MYLGSLGFVCECFGCEYIAPSARSAGSFFLTAAGHLNAVVSDLKKYTRNSPVLTKIRCGKGWSEITKKKYLRSEDFSFGSFK